MPDVLPVGEIREKFDEIASRVHLGGERIAMQRHGLRGYQSRSRSLTHRIIMSNAAQRDLRHIRDRTILQRVSNAIEWIGGRSSAVRPQGAAGRRRDPAYPDR